MSDGMSEEHKEALAKGRRQARIVRDYMEALEWKDRANSRPDRSDLEDKIAQLRSQIEEEEDSTSRVELVQKRLDLEEQLETIDDVPDVESREQDFIDIAREYSARKGISYMAWREVDVPASVLKEAGFRRTTTPPGQDD